MHSRLSYSLPHTAAQTRAGGETCPYVSIIKSMLLSRFDRYRSACAPDAWLMVVLSHLCLCNCLLFSYNLPERWRMLEVSFWFILICCRSGWQGDWFCDSCQAGSTPEAAEKLVTLRQRYLAGKGVGICRIVSISLLASEPLHLHPLLTTECT